MWDYRAGKLPIKDGWFNAPLILRNLAESIESDFFRSIGEAGSYDSLLVAINKTT